jgi:hypothetical protein
MIKFNLSESEKEDFMHGLCGYLAYDLRSKLGGKVLGIWKKLKTDDYYSSSSLDHFIFVLQCKNEKELFIDINGCYDNQDDILNNFKNINEENKFDFYIGVPPQAECDFFKEDKRWNLYTSKVANYIIKQIERLI